MSSNAPDEILTMCQDGGAPWRDANKLLRRFGLALRWSGKGCGGDQVMLRVEPLKGSTPPEPPMACPSDDCPGTIVGKPDRGRTSWGCNRCYLPVQLDRMAELAFERGKASVKR